MSKIIRKMMCTKAGRIKEAIEKIKSIPETIKNRRGR